MSQYQHDKVSDLVGTLNHWTNENDVPPVDDYLKTLAMLQVEIGVLAGQCRYRRETFSLLVSLPGLMMSDKLDILALCDLLVLEYKPLSDYVLTHMQHRISHDELFSDMLVAFYKEDYLVDLFEGTSTKLFLNDKQSLIGDI